MLRTLQILTLGGVALAIAAPFYGAEFWRRGVQLVRWAIPAEVHLGAAEGKLKALEDYAVGAQKSADTCLAEERRLVSQIDDVGKTKSELAAGLAVRKTDLATAAALSPEALATAKKEFGQWMKAYKDALMTEEKLRARLDAVRNRHARFEDTAHHVVERVDEARGRLADTAADVFVGQTDVLLAATSSTFDEVGSLARGPREFEQVLARLRAPMARTLADMSADELTARADELLAR